jgi:protein-disulfide isomerase
MRNILSARRGLAVLFGATLAFGAGALAPDTASAAPLAPKGDSLMKAADTGPDQALVRVGLGDVQAEDHVLGDPEAPVTLVEYASMTCPHCATFHEQTLPKLKAEFIDTGRVKMVFRHYPLDQRALDAALLTECFEGKRFFGMLDILFQQQRRWARADDPAAHFRKLGGLAGMGANNVNQCLNDDAMRDSILERQIKARDEADIRSTPSFILDGETISGNPGYEALAEKLRDAGA